MSFLVICFSVSAVMCAIIATGFLSSRALNPSCARWLGCNYSLFAVQTALGVLVFTNVWPEAAFVRAQCAMLLGPALYAYFASVLRPGLTPSLWHLAPALAMFAALITHWGVAIDPLIIASFSAYWLTVLWQLLAHRAAPAPSAAKRWLWILVLFLPINIVVETATSLEIKWGTPPEQSIALHIGSVVFMLFHTVTLLFMVARVPLIEWMHELKLPSGRPAMTIDDKRQLFARWQILVEERSLYKADPAITVSRAARLLSVPARQLSQAVNGVHGASFSQYLNDVRVDKAKALLKGQPPIGMTEVYLEAGFGTKSQFHREFSRVTGLTPSAYRDGPENS
ncbi:helix-turn-helix domain-containing protein [Gilvimarinus agarilyticus]|uniref:AraC family transcriptional regulator n=1 Tax=Gilvimarinus sp. 2_MG-2023 TaxID=3062666 RepID=UPI001C0A4AF8|nr:helix-turn-helix domain-containing protein [Gilvimarinus sp. 2_MG-2023]MBU2885615.1 helix-turn-helix domain-containing protein [Gilvimarinus agarilyticus]MDO6570481.1 helix-turn-helix domain-containing protein [Gilvimarinus sp. 2_MG-2023]